MLYLCSLSILDLNVYLLLLVLSKILHFTTKNRICPKPKRLPSFADIFSKSRWLSAPAEWLWAFLWGLTTSKKVYSITLYIVTSYQFTRGDKNLTSSSWSTSGAVVFVTLYNFDKRTVPFQCRVRARSNAYNLRVRTFYFPVRIDRQ